MIYLFVYNDQFGNREYVKMLINSIVEITAWRFDIPNSFYICSDSSAQELTDVILDKVPEANGGRFLIAQINENRQGYLPKGTWNFMKYHSCPQMR